MANRYPLILDTSDGNKLKELPAGDGLNLDGNTISSVGNVTSTGTVSATSFTGDEATITTITGTAIIQGETNLGNEVALKANSADLAAVAFSNNYLDLNDRPVVPTDINQLTDSEGLLSGGSFTSLSDTPDFYTGFALKVLRVNATETALEFTDVASGEITGEDVVAALGFTPYANTNPDGYINSYVGIVDALGYTPYNGDDNLNGYINDGAGVVSALGYTPYDNANPANYINNGAGVVSALGYTPYDAVTNSLGFITSITGTNVIDALGYTPYDGTTNSEGFLSSISSALVVGALGYTPYDDTNPDNYVAGYAGIIDVLGYTPYDDTNPAGYISQIFSSDVTTALGYTPYNASNPDNYITLDNISGTGDITYNNTTGVISFNNSSGYLTAESDTLSTVTGRGASTLLTITAGGFTTTGVVTTNDLVLTSTGTVDIDAGTGSTIVVGGTSNVSLRDASSSIDLQASLIPNLTNTYSLGGSSNAFSQLHVGTANVADIVFASSGNIQVTGSITYTPSATGNFRLSRGVLGLSSLTTTQRNALSTLQNGYILYNSTTNQYQAYAGSRGLSGPGWVNLWHGEPGAQPASPYPGQIAVADGDAWDPRGDGSEAMMVYIRGSWVQFAT